MRIWLYVFFCVSLLQEIAWHRLDDLQIANADFMSRGISGLKLYMVAPFLTWVSFDLHSLVSPHSCLLLFLLKYYKKNSLRSLKGWISTHQVHVPSRLDWPLKGSLSKT